jgi:hypothetical protein
LTPSPLPKRSLTLNIAIRVNQIETTRSDVAGADEYRQHRPEAIEALRGAVADGWPGGRVTWALSWLALFDDRPHYVEARRLVRRYHRELRDDVTFLPGGFFANAYNSVDQVNRDLAEGLARVAQIIGDGYRPSSVVAGLLSAANQAHLAELGIHVCQGNIWSQFDIDNQDGEGSICYPYYPSQEHFCKPAQAAADMIDCVNLDGWTCDFLAARRPGHAEGFNSRLGVGPIETIGAFPPELAQRQLMHTTATHFDRGVELNGWGWVTTLYEVSLVDDLRPCDVPGQLRQWLSAVRARWNDAECRTIGDFGQRFRQVHRDNAAIDYRFHQRGSGIGGSDANAELRWWMNQSFRLALLRTPQDSVGKVIDFTRYDQPAREPTVLTRRWSLLGQINQKGTRPQDQPAAFHQLDEASQASILSRCPDVARVLRDWDVGHESPGQPKSMTRVGLV